MVRGAFLCVCVNEKNMKKMKKKNNQSWSISPEAVRTSRETIKKREVILEKSVIIESSPPKCY